MSNIDKLPEFRYYYFTNRYSDTISFYKKILLLEEIRSWDRGFCDKGTIFSSPNGIGWIEIEEGLEEPILHGGLYIEVENVDIWHEKIVTAKIKIIQAISDTSYGHRSFKFQDPNGLSIALFTYNQRSVG